MSMEFSIQRTHSPDELNSLKKKQKKKSWNVSVVYGKRKRKCKQVFFFRWGFSRQMWRQLESHTSNRNIKKKQELALLPPLFLVNLSEKMKKKKKNSETKKNVVVRAAAQQSAFQSTLWYVCVLVKPIFSVDVFSPIVWCWFSRAEMDRTIVWKEKWGRRLWYPISFFGSSHTHTKEKKFLVEKS